MEEYNPSTHYRCAYCAEIFELQNNEHWSDEKALAELKETFNVPASECDIVCDQCYKLMVRS